MNLFTRMTERKASGFFVNRSSSEVLGDETGGRGRVKPRAYLSTSRLTLHNLNCREFLALDAHLIKITVYFHKKQILVDNSRKHVLSGSNMFPVTQEVGHQISNNQS